MLSQKLSYIFKHIDIPFFHLLKFDMLCNTHIQKYIPIIRTQRILWAHRHGAHLKSSSEPESEGRPEALSTTKLCKFGSIGRVWLVLLLLDCAITRSRFLNLAVTSRDISILKDTIGAPFLRPTVLMADKKETGISIRNKNPPSPFRFATSDKNGKCSKLFNERIRDVRRWNSKEDWTISINEVWKISFVNGY